MSLGVSWPSRFTFAPSIPSSVAEADKSDDAFRRRFLAQWPAGSPAHDSYFRRIESGYPMIRERTTEHAGELWRALAGCYRMRFQVVFPHRSAKHFRHSVPALSLIHI